ncbi:hypothetical protein K493DRAFT_219476 [Basidiobolus meristosporus CBS 931.73]|uniref:Thioesterase domain-containing protein n=1 Tax=Basidiobolus meristosporus CBS 931.73 TaxID=1314790 RepID=A0A1Y1YBC6_9FUNG|nr:hypothetical protein K493DRAFT_219476 [Basidiobolus meristosporus CBS 931.73]|eukprot:ORX95288.1 hypothetical protein K493DRAFT_219476 [Basidiobolus meristosporus CBS 931.73]
MFGGHTWRRVKLLSVSPDCCVFQLTVQPEDANPIGGLHGACIAQLIDMGTSVLVKCMSETGFQYGAGVSTELNISFVTGAVVGDILEIECKVVKRGKYLAYTMTQLKRVTPNKKPAVVAFGGHTKFNLDTRPNNL